MYIRLAVKIAFLGLLGLPRRSDLSAIALWRRRKRSRNAEAGNLSNFLEKPDYEKRYD
jgi:hypothetical protein